MVHNRRLEGWLVSSIVKSVVEEGIDSLDEQVAISICEHIDQARDVVRCVEAVLCKGTGVERCQQMEGLCMVVIPLTPARCLIGAACTDLRAMSVAEQ
jgi:hypothetical protein